MKKYLIPFLLLVPLAVYAATLTMGTDADGGNADTSSGTSYYAWAQSFTAIAGDYTATTVHKGPNGGSGKVINGSIQANNAGVPSGTALATFTVPAADSGGEFTYTFDAAETLTATTYWIVFDYTEGSANYSSIGIDASNPYAGGILLHKNSAGTWLSDFSTYDLWGTLTYTVAAAATVPDLNYIYEEMG